MGTSVHNLKGKGCTVAPEDVLLSVTYNFYSDKIITPQARFCWTLSQIWKKALFAPIDFNHKDRNKGLCNYDFINIPRCTMNMLLKCRY